MLCHSNLQVEQRFVGVTESVMTESTEGDRYRSDGWSHISWVWWARAFALGSLVHITLPDFAQSGGTGP